MYAYIRGTLVERNPAYAVIDCGGVGYLMHISLNCYSSLPEKGEVKLFAHLAIREDAHVLYGFFNESEREVFRKLISVSGVGASTARMVLSALTPKEVIRAVQSANVAALKNVKGIGPKTAQRIIVDLRDKISEAGEIIPELEGADNTKGGEALSALVSLGFERKAAEKVVNDIVKESGNIPVEAIIKAALKKL
jgi:Holliday junction DNA helicase RuvA